MDPTTQQRILLLANSIIQAKGYKYLIISDEKKEFTPYETLNTEQKEELGDFFGTMLIAGFIFYGFTSGFGRICEKIVLSDFEHYDFVFTLPVPDGNTFYTTNNKLKELIPKDFIQYIPIHQNNIMMNILD